MPYPIYDWNDIANNYRGTLLLGNGASRAVDERFGYPSLVQHAFNQGLLTEDIQSLFHFFKTKDFELVLRLVWQATNINQSLNIPDQRTREAYVHVRESLIKTIRNVHPEYQEVLEQIPRIYNFVKGFDTAISLNYDLILYWAVMYGQNIPDGCSLKDCFVDGSFYEDWRRLRQSIWGNVSTTLAFYPHGSLVLARNLVETEFKLSGNGGGLLESILRAWQTEHYVPLFVSEGTAQQKINAIKGSSYLNTVYREVLTSLASDLVIYGWGLWEQDLYILDRISASGINRVAISVYNGDQTYCNRAYEVVRQHLGPATAVQFFHSNSAGCWNNVA
jgi:Domain of unknown function (DUF4917)